MASDLLADRQPNWPIAGAIAGVALLVALLAGPAKGTCEVSLPPGDDPAA